MILSHTPDDVTDYTCRQLESFFPDGKMIDRKELRSYVGLALNRIEDCFSCISHQSYNESNHVRFDIFHSDQYCTYLYLLSNTIFRDNGDLSIAKRLFYLNKTLHAFNCMYDTLLPEVFWLIHVVGTVLGKANYGNYLVVRQNCTVGAMSGTYPTIGEGFVMSAGSSLIGDCRVGKNVMLGPGCTVVNLSIEDNTLLTSGNNYTYRINSNRALDVHFHGRS